MRDTWPLLEQIAFPPIRRGRLDTLQVNLGYRCNQSCVHCHVNAGPNRTEEMSSEVVDVVLAFLARKRVATLDITGGAPELNQHFRKLVRAARKMDVQVMDRCNLTVLEVPGQEDLAQFLACEEVEITASMPCYLEDNVDRQRGKGVFEGSLRGLQRLNKLGYGRAETGLVLNLVYNPQGPSLPPSQETLEADYKRVLGERYGIEFNRLYTLANMPIQRFGAILVSQGEFDRYIDLLRHAHLDANLEHVMCRNLISVDWRGYVYDCDFNQMLDLPLEHDGRRADAPLGPARRRDRGQTDPGCRPLLRMRGRPGIELRGRAPRGGGVNARFAHIGAPRPVAGRRGCPTSGGDMMNWRLPSGNHVGPLRDAAVPMLGKSRPSLRRLSERAPATRSLAGGASVTVAGNPDRVCPPISSRRAGPPDGASARVHRVRAANPASG